MISVREMFSRGGPDPVKHAVKAALRRCQKSYTSKDKTKLKRSLCSFLEDCPTMNNVGYGSDPIDSGLEVTQASSSPMRAFRASALRKQAWRGFFGPA